VGILKFSSQIGQTVKNVGRLKTIVAVMGKHGLAEIVERIGVLKLIPDFTLRRDKEKERLTLPERFRLSFEELGPAFVKLGQVLSTRPDLIPEEFAEEFKNLQDSVKPVEFLAIKEIVEKELKAPLSMLYKTFSEAPLAAASIAQVHEAMLHDGTEVVVKVQRPGIDKIIDTDINILFIIAGLVEKYVEETKTFNPRGIVEEFFKSLRKELDFVVEAGNMARIQKNFEGHESIIIPKVYRELSATKVLTLQKIEGIRFSNLNALQEKKVDVKNLTHNGVQAFYKMVLVDGIFHGDLHAGNMFVLADEKIGLVDFGIVGRINQRTRDALGNMFLALVTEDYEALVYEYCEIGIATGKVDVDHFTKQVRELVEPYYGLPLKDINVGRMLLELTVEASRHNLKMSQDLMLVFKALITIEGMGRSIDPDFDIVHEMGEFAKILFKTKYDPSRLSKEFAYLLRDSATLLQMLPRQLKQILRRLSNDEWVSHVKIEGLELYQETEMKGKQLLSLSILIAAIVLSSTIVLIFHKDVSLFGLSPFGVLGLGLAAILSLIYLVSYFKK